jgi:hypothetical protein
MEDIMKRSALYVSLLSLALTPLIFGHMTSASGNRMPHTIVAATGAAAADGGHYALFFNARLNARPEVAFDALLTGPSTSGVFMGDGRTTSTIALGGNPDPSAGNFGFVMKPFITPNGNVVFNVDFNNVFVRDQTQSVPLAQAGDQATGGGTLTPLLSTANDAGTNDKGAVAYLAQVTASTATQGIFRADETGTLAIARDDIGAPTGGTFVAFFEPVINNRGQVAFGAEMGGGPADFGIFRGDGVELLPVFIANQIAPGGGTFTDFGHPEINAHGQVAVVASMTHAVSRIGLFVGDGTNAAAIAVEGQEATTGAQYGGTFMFPHRLNDQGEVAFHVELTGGRSSHGIFRGDGQRTTVVALAGTIAPGTNGTFESFHDMKLGNDGRVAFIATLAVGVGDVDPSNNMGIWIGTSDEDLRLLVRTSEIIGGSVLTRLPTDIGGLGLTQFDMNENAVAWIGSFEFGSAVVYSQIGAALGSDLVLLQETFAQASLVERLTRRAPGPAGSPPATDPEPACRLDDTSECTTCGDGRRDGMEVCDGADLGGWTCRLFGYREGELGCSPSCGFFDESRCL